VTAARSGKEKGWFTPKGRLLKLITVTLIASYRLTGGLIGGRLRGLPGILLTTMGRRSGEPRTVHLPYVADGADMVVVASFAGGPRNPAWFLNLVSNPDVTIQSRRQVFTARAVPVPDDERATLWAKVTGVAPWYAEYAKATARQIPLVRIQRP
jgi:deazaflavin-dependent oxidoreductase (nitroreductase family)